MYEAAHRRCNYDLHVFGMRCRFVTSTRQAGNHYDVAEHVVASTGRR